MAAVGPAILLAGGVPSGVPRSASTTGSAGSAAAARTPTPIPSAPPSTDAGTPSAAAVATVAHMTLAARTGAVVMTAGTVAELPSPASLVRRYGLGGVMIRGRSAAGVGAVASAVRAVQPQGLPVLIATDQEGGEVQVLRGPGFDEIPSALT